MQFLLPILVSIFFILNLIITRFFFKQMAKKIDALIAPEMPEEDPIMSKQPADLMKGYKTPSAIPMPGFHADRPAKNEVMNPDENDFELNENMPISLPPEVKIEVEGGDTMVPPGYNAKSN